MAVDSQCFRSLKLTANTQAINSLPPAVIVTAHYATVTYVVDEHCIEHARPHGVGKKISCSQQDRKKRVSRSRHRKLTDNLR